MCGSQKGGFQTEGEFIIAMIVGIILEHKSIT